MAMHQSLSSKVATIRSLCANVSLILLLLVAFSSRNNAIILPPSTRQVLSSPSSLSQLIESPHIAYISNSTTEIFIIGTSHFSSNSASEVNTLISHLKPDGVVLELDPERCLRLTKQSCGFDASGVIRETREIMYGADFLSAVTTCQELDIPLFLGDEYAQETRERLLRLIGDIGAYSPIPLIQSVVSSFDETSSQRSRIKVVETFRRDPKKLTPLVITTAPPFILASVFSLLNSKHDAIAYENSFDVMTSLGSVIEIGAVLIASMFLSCLLYNNIIVERDIILSKSTVEALNVLRLLKNGNAIRKRWEFQASKKNTALNQTLLSNEGVTAESEERLIIKNAPLFTLKTPIQKGMTRKLNLFEPRWLTMMDHLTNSSDSSKNLKLGCVRCINKFYSAISIDGNEGRYADVIFERIGNLADVIDVQEGKRPVSGDRRLDVKLCGGDSFVVDESNIFVCDDGYMIATAVEPQCLQQMTATFDQNQPNSVDEKVKLVVVVGLLHGNGVGTLLSSSEVN